MTRAAFGPPFCYPKLDEIKAKMSAVPRSRMANCRSGGIVWNHTAALQPLLRGSLKKLFLICSVLVLILRANTSQLAFIVLNEASLGPGRMLPNWQVKVNHGRPEFGVCTDAEGPCLHLRSVKSSFALQRDVDIDPSQMPFLTWKWKVTQLPPGGDFRRASTDDQAAQVLIAFSDRRVLTYLWDTNAPKGAFGSASEIPLVHIFAVVCESGSTDANRWVAENRNVAADYQRAYGKPAPRVKGLRLQINSQHTGTIAESYFGEVAFRSTPQ